MRKRSKLAASGFLAMIALTLMVTVSYAWFTMAGSPALTGVQVNIGGSNTIKIAADMVKEVDGKKIHYPGYFIENMNVTQHGSYDYLEKLAGLTPVSTADGIHWFLPNEEMIMAMDTEYSLDDYQIDDTLGQANILTTDNTRKAESGSYAYLDFWVVSPMDDCTLRVSIGSSEEGSYLIALPKVVKDESTATGYALKEEDDVAACARVGFLVNTDVVEENEPMEAYSGSKYYDRDFRKLKGIYQEAGENVEGKRDYSFSIYEPNGTMHNNAGVSLVQSSGGLSYTECEDGDYAITFPIGVEEEEAKLKNIAGKLAVQGTNEWRLAENGDTILSQIFQSTMLSKDLTGLEEEEIAQLFYKKELEGNYSEYVNRAAFFEDVKDLYTSGDGKVVRETQMLHTELGNTTKTASIVKLERDVPQRIRMFVWLEGQDGDCVRQASSEYFAIGIELAGSTQD